MSSIIVRSPLGRVRANGGSCVQTRPAATTAAQSPSPEAPAHSCRPAPRPSGTVASIIATQPPTGINQSRSSVIGKYSRPATAAAAQAAGQAGSRTRSAIRDSKCRARSELIANPNQKIGATLLAQKRA